MAAGLGYAAKAPSDVACGLTLRGLRRQCWRMALTSNGKTEDSGVRRGNTWVGREPCECLKDSSESTSPSQETGQWTLTRSLTAPTLTFSRRTTRLWAKENNFPAVSASHALASNQSNAAALVSFHRILRRSCQSPPPLPSAVRGSGRTKIVCSSFTSSASSPSHMKLTPRAFSASV